MVPQVMEALVKLLADTKRPLRFAAAKSLAMLGDDTWEQARQSASLVPSFDQPADSSHCSLSSTYSPPARIGHAPALSPQHSHQSSHLARPATHARQPLRSTLRRGDASRRSPPRTDPQ